jgi:hypothetical protein
MLVLCFFAIRRVLVVPRRRVLDGLVALVWLCSTPVCDMPIAAFVELDTENCHNR